jgi:hypothetical protein
MFTHDFDPIMWTSAPQRMKVLGPWQKVVHGIGEWLQDFAYDHSPEVVVEPPDEAVQSTWTKSVRYYQS